MKKQVGLKFDEEDLARWDEFAESQGWSRTTLIETAVERLLGSTGKAPGPVERSPGAQMENEVPREAEAPGLPFEERHRARPGIRRVFICTHQDKGAKWACNYRIALPKEVPGSTIPSCPEHGPMVRQANKPYRGESTEPLASQNWPPAGA